MYNFKHIIRKDIPQLVEYNKQRFPERGEQTENQS